jgi:hypothetical protein
VIRSRHYIRDDTIIIKLSVYLDWVTVVFFTEYYKIIHL